MRRAEGSRQELGHALAAPGTAIRPPEDAQGGRELREHLERGGGGRSRVALASRASPEDEDGGRFRVGEEGSVERHPLGGEGHALVAPLLSALERAASGAQGRAPRTPRRGRSPERESCRAEGGPTCGVDEIGVDQIGVAQSGVDPSGGDEIGRRRPGGARSRARVPRTAGAHRTVTGSRSPAKAGSWSRSR